MRRVVIEVHIELRNDTALHTGEFFSAEAKRQTKNGGIRDKKNRSQKYLGDTYGQRTCRETLNVYCDNARLRYFLYIFCTHTHTRAHKIYQSMIDLRILAFARTINNYLLLILNNF